MRPLRYSINVTIDGCYDHASSEPDAELHRHSTETIERADALIFGRVVYGLMETGWRPFAETGIRPDWMAEWMEPFARAIHAKKKYVVSDTLQSVDWNAEIIRGADLAEAVRDLKSQPGNGLYTAGVTLPLVLAELGLIDEYQFVVHPQLAGRGPSPFAGLSKPLDLALTAQKPFPSGAIALTYSLKG